MVPFQQNLDLLRSFLTHREAIVESIEAVLNAQRKPIASLQDHSLLSRLIEDCFLARNGSMVKTLRTEVEDAHWAAGFKPRPVRDLHNDLIHPAEMMVRAFYCWQQTRWPGGNGRIHYAQTLFNLYVLRWLQFLCMRIWDEGSASARLADIQGVLDELWRTSPAGQPAMVRDARWLIPLSQSLITDELAPYFEVARLVTETLPEADVLEIQKAHVRMLGGHLTSQIRYYSLKDNVPVDHLSVVLRTRSSNALDFALLIYGLVDLLKAYDRALRSGDERSRMETAGATFQGVSADPELFLNRLDLLSAYSMIEHVFIARNLEGRVDYSPAGDRHVKLLKEYTELIERLIQPLRDDFPRYRPAEGTYSPSGLVFGLPSHLIEHMALKAIQHDAETRFSLEDLFENGNSEKLAWVNGWRDLPHVHEAARRMYDYPHQFAKQVYSRVESELRAERCELRTGHLYIGRADDIPELPARYFVSSDKQMAAAHKAEPSDRAQLLAGRREGHFLVSYETPGGWTALKKDLLTEILGAGGHAKITGLPVDAAQVCGLMLAGVCR
jgi:hypothetical protein